MTETYSFLNLLVLCLSPYGGSLSPGDVHLIAFLHRPGLARITSFAGKEDDWLLDLSLSWIAT